MNPGSIVYTKRVRQVGKWDGKARTFIEFQAKKQKMFITMLLGVQEEKADLPSKKELIAMTSGFGMISLDDLHECFGDKGLIKFRKFFAKKYKDQ